MYEEQESMENIDTDTITPTYKDLWFGGQANQVFSNQVPSEKSAWKCFKNFSEILYIIYYKRFH